MANRAGALKKPLSKQQTVAKAPESWQDFKARNRQDTTDANHTPKDDTVVSNPEPVGMNMSGLNFPSEL